MYSGAGKNYLKEQNHIPRQNYKKNSQKKKIFKYTVLFEFIVS